MFVFQQNREELRSNRKTPFFEKFYHSPQYKREDQFFENPQAAQGSHVPVSMGLIFEILSPELKSAFEKAWKFLEGKIHLQYLLEIVGKKKSGVVQLHKYLTGILRYCMWRKGNKIPCTPQNPFVSISVIPGKKGQASRCLSEIWKY